MPGSWQNTCGTMQEKSFKLCVYTFAILYLFCTMIMAIQSEGYTCFPIRSLKSRKDSIRKSCRRSRQKRQETNEDTELYYKAMCQSLLGIQENGNLLAIYSNMQTWMEIQSLYNSNEPESKFLVRPPSFKVQDQLNS